MTVIGTGRDSSLFPWQPVIHGSPPDGIIGTGSDSKSKHKPANVILKQFNYVVKFLLIILLKDSYI